MKYNISLLMANFNCEKYIEKAIKSVIDQTSPDWELIIIDDCSTDNSLKKIKPFLKNNKIKLIKNKKNKGYGASLKTAVEKSSYDILGRIDSDDALHKDAVKTMIKAHKNNSQYGLIYSTYYECNSNLNIKRICKNVGKIKKNKTNLHTPKVSHFETFRKKDYDKTSGFDPKKKKAVDKDLIFKLEEVTRLKFINKPLYYYRMHEKGISQGKNMLKAQIYYTIAEYEAYKRRLKSKFPNISKKDMSDKFFRAAYACLQLKEKEKAKKFLRRSIWYNPTNLRYFKTYFKRIILNDQSGLF